MNRNKLFSKVDGLSIRPSGSWIDRKHFFLRKYADIFTKGMKKKWHSLTFIDLFAGPGRCVIAGTSEEREGSPLIALDYEFGRYIFLEKDEDDFASLNKRCKPSPKFSSIEFINGDCNEVIDQVKPDGLSLAFIDPTDIGVHFDTVRNLTENRQVDLLMNIQFGMDIKRNFPLYSQKKSGSKLDQFLGGEVDWARINDPNDVLILYKERILELGYGTAEFKPVVKNNNNLPMYFLFFASRHPRGLDFWEKITQEDETGQRRLL